MLKSIFAKDEVNTGRQREFDYLKGFMMLLIFIIHAFQGTLSPKDDVMRSIYIFNSMSGAAVFIFVMGFGTTYSRHASPGEFAKSGVRFVIYQYLNNLAYLAAYLLPLPFIINSLSSESLDTVSLGIEIYGQYTNIFFISGIFYLIFALLKKLKAHTLVYFIIGTAAAIAAPFIYGKAPDIPVLGYIIRLMIGEANFVSFTPLYFLSYAMYGVTFGRIFRKVKDKKKFYLCLMPVCAVIVAVWWVLFFIQNGTNLTELYSIVNVTYTHPDIWHVVASMAHIFLMSGLIFFIVNAAGNKEPKNIAAKQLLYYNKHISKHYALHMLTYLLASALHSYLPFESWQCWILTMACMVTTEIAVRGYNAVYDKIMSRKNKSNKDNKDSKSNNDNKDSKSKTDSNKNKSNKGSQKNKSKKNSKKKSKAKKQSRKSN